MMVSSLVKALTADPLFMLAQDTECLFRQLQRRPWSSMVWVRLQKRQRLIL